MKNRIAIDINNNPFVDTYANLTHDQALAIIHKDFGKTRLYIEESKKFLTNRNYRTYSMDSEAFKDSIRNAIEITIGKLEIPKDILTELMDIYLLLRTYTSNAEDIVKNASSFENFIKTIEGYWETYLERNKIHKVGNMRIHVLNPKLKATDLKFFLKAFENVQNKTTSTGIPHFSAALYGDFFIVSPHDLSSLAQYSPNRDVISINSINISYGLTHVEQSIIHELCHRYYRKVLNKKEKEEWLDFFFRTQKSTLSREKPKIGDSLFFKYGLSINKPRPYSKNPKTLEKKIVTVPGEDHIHRIDVDEDGVEHYAVYYSDGTECLVSWRQLAQVGIFPTPYAKFSDEEFFCETVPRFMYGDLHEPLKTWFETEIHNKFVAPYQKDNKDQTLVFNKKG